MPITTAQQGRAEAELRQAKQSFDYNSIDYPLEMLLNEFVLDCPRELTWDETLQSCFVESVLLGLSLHPIRVAETGEEHRFHVIDGVQRILALTRFVNNQLRLCDLEVLESFNGFAFADLLPARQRRFKRTMIRCIKFGNLSEAERRDLRDRLEAI